MKKKVGVLCLVLVILALISLNISYATYPDSDGDGIADANDKCPNTPSNTPVDRDGCSCGQKTCPDDCINGICVRHYRGSGGRCRRNDDCDSGTCNEGVCSDSGGGSGLMVGNRLYITGTREQGHNPIVSGVTLDNGGKENPANCELNAYFKGLWYWIGKVDDIHGEAHANKYIITTAGGLFGAGYPVVDLRDYVDSYSIKKLLLDNYGVPTPINIYPGSYFCAQDGRWYGCDQSIAGKSVSFSDGRIYLCACTGSTCSWTKTSLPEPGCNIRAGYNGYIYSRCEPATSEFVVVRYDDCGIDNDVIAEYCPNGCVYEGAFHAFCRPGSVPPPSSCPGGCPDKCGTGADSNTRYFNGVCNSGVCSYNSQKPCLPTERCSLGSCVTHSLVTEGCTLTTVCHDDDGNVYNHSIGDNCEPDVLENDCGGRGCSNGQCNPCNQIFPNTCDVASDGKEVVIQHYSNCEDTPKLPECDYGCANGQCNDPPPGECAGTCGNPPQDSACVNNVKTVYTSVTPTNANGCACYTSGESSCDPCVDDPNNYRVYPEGSNNCLPSCGVALGENAGDCYCAEKNAAGFCIQSAGGCPAQFPVKTADTWDCNPCCKTA